jgi:hypothetical protein
VPNTGDWQRYTTVSVPVTLAQGAQTIRLLSTGGGGWNINWLQFAYAPAAVTRIGDSPAMEVPTRAGDIGFFIYPNPVAGDLYVQLRNSSTGTVQAAILRLDGVLLESTQWNVAGRSTAKKMNVSHLRGGTYVLRLLMNGRVQTLKFIKL